MGEKTSLGTTVEKRLIHKIKMKWSVSVLLISLIVMSYLASAKAMSDSDFDDEEISKYLQDVYDTHYEEIDAAMFHELDNYEPEEGGFIEKFLGAFNFYV